MRKSGYRFRRERWVLKKTNSAAEEIHLEKECRHSNIGLGVSTLAWVSNEVIDDAEFHIIQGPQNKRKLECPQTANGIRYAAKCYGGGRLTFELSAFALQVQRSTPLSKVSSFK